MKRLIRGFSLFLGVILLLMLLIVASCFVFKDTILKKAESNLAKKLGTEINTADLDLDPFTHFPYFTLAFEDLEIRGSQNQHFIQAKYVEILIHPLSTIQEEVDISTFILNEGKVFLSKSGEQWNFDFSDIGADNNASSKEIVLSDLLLNNIALQVTDPSQKLTADINIETFAGSLSLSAKTNLTGTLTLVPQKIQRGDYLAIANEKWNVLLDVTTENGDNNIDQLEIDFGKNHMALNGAINDMLDLQGELSILDKESLLTWIPEEYNSYVFNDSTYEFSLGGKITNPDGQLKVKTEELNIYLIKNKDAIQMDGKIESTFLNTFQDDYHFTQGSILMSKLIVDQQSPTLESMSGTLRVKDVETEYIGKTIAINTEEIILDHGNSIVKKLTIVLDNSDLQFDGSISKSQDTYSFLGKLASDKTVASDFLSMMQDTTESTIKIKGEFDIEIDELINNEWEGNDIKGKITYIDDTLDYRVTLESFDGSIESNGRFENKEELHFLCNASFKTLEIEEILDQLQNLGQELITSENLKGTLTGNATLDFSFNQDLEIDKSKSHALVAVTAQKGRLVGFKLLEDFSKYIDIDDLRDVQFDNMTNYFEWKGDHLVIPVMYIKNNAANFLISGYHSVDSKILYHLQINASEILAKKFGKKKRKAKKKGWWNMYYLVEGDTENFEVRSEKDQVKAGLNKSLIEKEEIFDKLVTVFGYTEVLQSIEDWEDL